MYCDSPRQGRLVLPAQTLAPHLARTRTLEQRQALVEYPHGTPLYEGHSSLPVYAYGESPLNAEPIGRVYVNKIPLQNLVWKKYLGRWSWASYRVTKKPHDIFYYEVIT